MITACRKIKSQTTPSLLDSSCMLSIFTLFSPIHTFHLLFLENFIKRFLNSVETNLAAVMRIHCNCCKSSLKKWNADVSEPPFKPSSSELYMLSQPVPSGILLKSEQGDIILVEIIKLLSIQRNITNIIKQLKCKQVVALQNDAYLLNEKPEIEGMDAFSLPNSLQANITIKHCTLIYNRP